MSAVRLALRQVGFTNRSFWRNPAAAFFTFSGANKVSFRRWSGGTNITLDDVTSELSLEVVGGGGQTIAVGGADVEIRGTMRAVTLTGITTDTTAQIAGVTGPISLGGADGTVNIYGAVGTVTDSRTGTPLGTVTAVSHQELDKRHGPGLWAK